MFKLTPTNTQFYDHFDHVASLMVRCADHLFQTLDTFENASHHADEIKKLEHEADEVTHETIELLRKSFITPLDRGDIRHLTEALDDVLDLIEGAITRLVLYEVDSTRPEVSSLAKVLVDTTHEVQTVVGKIRNLRKGDDIHTHFIEIHRLENQGDQLYRRIVAGLFKSDVDPFTVIKWREVLEKIETAIDRCEDVANVVEGIVLENA